MKKTERRWIETILIKELNTDITLNYCKINEGDRRKKNF